MCGDFPPVTISDCKVIKRGQSAVFSFRGKGIKAELCVLCRFHCAKVTNKNCGAEKEGCLALDVKNEWTFQFKMSLLQCCCPCQQRPAEGNLIYFAAVIPLDRRQDRPFSSV